MPAKNRTFHPRATLLTLLITCLIWASPITYTRAADHQHPFTVDDYLKFESTGRASVDPKGRWLVYEYIPPYDQLPDYSVGHLGTWNVEGGGHLMLVDLASSTPVAIPLFTPDPQSIYWIDSFSPDGNSLAFYAVRKGHVRLGIFDIQTKRLREFDPSPRVDWTEGHTSTWISPHSLIYAAEAPGDEPWALSFRRHTGERFTAEWEKAWQGKEPAVNVVESHSTPGSEHVLPGRLILADAGTDQVEVLATGQFDSLQASSDGRYLAALRQSELPQPDPHQRLEDWLTSRSTLLIFDLHHKREPFVVTPERAVYPGTLAWAPDSDRLAYFSWPAGQKANTGVFQAWEGTSGRVVPYPHTGLDLASERERGYYQRPERVAWIGGRLAVFARATPDPHSTPAMTYRDIESPNVATQPAKADWFLLDSNGAHENLTQPLHKISAIPLQATRKQLFVLADGHVWRLEPHHAPTDMTPTLTGKLGHPDTVRYTSRHPPFDGFAAFETKKDAQSVFTLVDMRSPTVRFREVLSPSERSRFMAGSAVAGSVLFREDQADGSNIVLSQADGNRVVLTRLNRLLGQIARSKWIKIKYPVGTGRELESCVLLPPDYQPGKRYPTIAEVYPGRGASCLTSDSAALGGSAGSYSMHLLAARGFIVIEPNLPHDLMGSNEGPIAKMPALVLQAVDALIQQGYADPARLGLMGLSQGGISSLWVATRSDRFKAVVSLNSWADLFSHYFQGAEPVFSRFYQKDFPYIGEATRYEATAGSEFSMGGSAWDNPEIYIRNSPVFEARKITAATLLIHSDMDIFPMAQYDEMFSALYRNRKEAAFVRYWGEGHSPSSPANIRDMWQRIFAWFDAHIR